MKDHVERAPVGVVELVPDGTVRSLNRAAANLLAVDDTAASGEPIATVFPESVESRVPAAFDATPVPERSFDEFYPELDRWLSVSLVPVDDAVYLYLQDRSERYRTGRELTAVEAELRRSALTNELIADLLAALASASDRTEIAATICEQLDDADGYDVAWVGQREIGADALAVDAATATTNRTLECIRTQLDAGERVPERRAIESGAVECVQPLGEDESVPDPIRRAAFADGLQSLLAVPLTHGSSVYGVVGIYASDRNAFSERERSSFATVGEMAGFAINATRNRSLLRSNAVVELTFDLADATGPLVAAAAETDASLSLDGLVRHGERVVCYLEIVDTDPAAVADVFDARASVTSTRVVSTAEDAGSIEVTIGADTPIGLLLTEGATVQSAQFGGEADRLTVELSPDEDVRRIADVVVRRFDAAVLAKRERERDPRSVTDFRAALADRLTDRQEEALRTAFHADYFESPRGSNAEEVAGTLDVTGPTLLHHLRAAQRKLLSEVFETTDG